MKHIQWFPGHMTAAIRMMEENLKMVDGVIMILDARAPKASINKNLEGLFNNKKVLYVLNKSDLVESSDIKNVISEFVKEGKEVISISSMEKKGADYLYSRIFSMLKERLEKNKEKGINKPLRVMVAGVPNTGKSTVINSLCGQKKAITGDKAGVTKGKQWVKIKDLELLDTPGTMPPAFEDQQKAKHLAYIGSINDDILDFDDLAFEFIKETAQKYPKLYLEKYGVEDVNQETLEIMNRICVKRGFLLKGGEYDYSRCAKAVIDDFRKGRIGKIILE